jgi:amino acid adenylation domain-containing protein
VTDEAHSALSLVEKRALLRKLVAEGPTQARVFPTSFSQQRLWFMDRLVPGSAFYNVEAAIPIHAALNPTAFERAINEIVARHDTLRTTFREEKGEPVQVVAPKLTVPLPIHDLRHLSPSLRQSRQLELRSAGAQEPFNLADGPLIRTELVRVQDAEWLFLLHLHHIIADGWSMGIFSRELTALYEALAHGRRSSLTPLTLQYGDYAAWQRKCLSGPLLEQLTRYWTGQLAGIKPLNVPTDRPRPPVQSHRGAFHTVEFDEDLTRALVALGRQATTTLFMTLLTGFKVLLARYAGEEDVAIGTYIANRERAEIEGLIGFFLNTLVLRTRISLSATFRSALASVRETALGAYAHQALPFERLVEELQPDRDLSRNPLVQVIFQLQNASTGGTDGEGALVDYQRGTAIFDLAVTSYESRGRIHATYEYSTDLFDAGTIRQMARHFERLLKAAVEQPDVPVGDLDFLDPAERHRILVTWNETNIAYPAETGITDLFRRRVATNPQAIAFIEREARMTFGELEEQSNKIARRLIGLGVSRNAMVGVCLDRSFDLVAAMLATWKAGAVYVPLDPDYPAKRLAFMLSDCGAKVVIGRSDLAVSVEFSGVNVLLLDRDAVAGGQDSVAVPDVIIGPDCPSHIIYTSGSTGTPKGALSAHRQILNRLHWMWRTYPQMPGEVGVAKTAISFIDSLWELLGPLLSGQPSVLARRDDVLSPTALVALMARHRVSRIWVVPSYLRVLLDSVPDLGAKLPHLKFWVASGEVLPVELAQAFDATLPHAILYNLYGTSEVWDATWHDPKKGLPQTTRRVPIGRPIDNVRVYVLDERKKPVPVGVVGELHVAGHGVWPGFLNGPDPLARSVAPLGLPESGAQFVKSCGDLVRWRSDGELEFVGRKDNELKIRGTRIEPAEVEAVLMHCDQIASAAVLDWVGRDGQAQLGAYLVAQNGRLTNEQLRNLLARTLPGFMIPDAYEYIEGMPMTPSGKIDRDELKRRGAPKGVAPSELPIEARNATEREIADIWAKFLVERVGVATNFFAAGGHSLLAARILSRMNEKLSIELSLRDFFETPTIAAIAAKVDRLRAAGGEARSAIPRVARRARPETAPVPNAS